MIMLMLMHLVLALAWIQASVSTSFVDTPLDLGLAQPYAVLAGSGITSSGTVGTVITGNLGTFPGAGYSGFPPAIVNGDVNLANSASENAQIALTTAYDTLAAKPFNRTLTNAELGGITLLPGVYKIDAAAAMVGDLTLDANGDVGAIWTFQMSSTLLFGVDSGVVFKDSIGNPDYVYWQVTSSATLATGVRMIGNIIALVSITINDGATVSGRCLARNAAVTLDKTVVTLPPTGSSAPTITPSKKPSATPTTPPSSCPSAQPSGQPSCMPVTGHPSSQPSANPSASPSSLPSSQPSNAPSSQPTAQPSCAPVALPSSVPSSQPSGHPSAQPSGSPTCQPSADPSSQPSCTPTSQPSAQPSTQPSTQPSSSPTTHPSAGPSAQPSGSPTCQPTADPSSQPSTMPTSQPSAQPSTQPITQPSAAPSTQPSAVPSAQPSARPSDQPSSSPSSQPSSSPSMQPSGQPSAQPSVSPSNLPTTKPTSQPSDVPSSQPSSEPSVHPSGAPTAQPSSDPTSQPTELPSTQPSSAPSGQPTSRPSSQPVASPSSLPTYVPSSQPSGQPSAQPATQPSGQPTGQPSLQPSAQPTIHPSTQPSGAPTVQPSAFPSTQPSESPSSHPSGAPSGQPTADPSSQPSCTPTTQPSVLPSNQPSSQPSSSPTTQPSARPSDQPTSSPSSQPLATPSSQPTCVPSGQPSGEPTVQPSAQPSEQPSTRPSNQPSSQPSASPTTQPSARPTDQPSSSPSSEPLATPSSQPTCVPSGQPSGNPTMQPSAQPSGRPSAQPSIQPSTQPSAHPSSQPSVQPSREPTMQPSSGPSSQPSGHPSTQPSSHPSTQPSASPSGQPSDSPTALPSAQPSTQPSAQPSASPTTQPSASPSEQPSARPSSQPQASPSSQPTSSPSGQPSAQPSEQPSAQPSALPSMQSSASPSAQPSAAPSAQPSTRPSDLPSSSPSCQPLAIPSSQPTCAPSDQPSGQPTTQPSAQPTGKPSCQPSVEPSMQPSSEPSTQPTALPSSQPSAHPSSQPSAQPSHQPLSHPTAQPSSGPTSQPSSAPSAQPSQHPSAQPSSAPSAQPTAEPSGQPSETPSSQPSAQPSMQPSSQPSASPTTQSIARPSSQPSSSPSSQPVASPSTLPTCMPSGQPSGQPTTQPSAQPSGQPSAQPSSQPSGFPSSQPTAFPSTELYPEFYQPSKLSVFNITRTSAAVTVKVTSTGNMYCAAIPADVTVKSVVDIKNAGVFTLLVERSYGTIRLKDLSPDTNYYMYCYTEDFASHVMPLSTVLDKRVAFSTLCCSNIDVLKTFSNIVQYVSGNTRPESEFVVGLASKPASPVKMSMTLSQLNCQDSTVLVPIATDVTAHPGNFMFYPNSTSLARSFVIRGPNAGCFQVSFSTTGATEYIPTASRFSIQSASLPPNVPVLTSVQFSDAGTELLFIFDSATDRGASRVPTFASVFNCSLLTAFPGSASSTCRWTNTTQMSVQFPSTGNPTPEVGNTVFLLGDVVRAGCVTNTNCSSYAYVAATSTKILTAVNAIEPTAILSAAAVISACDDIRLDPTLSRGFGGRSWKAVTWIVTGNSPRAGRTNDIASYLNTNFKDTFQIAMVPNVYLNSSTAFVDAIYTITLCATSFLDRTSCNKVIVKVNPEGANVVPSIVLTGGNAVVYRWQPISLFATVTWPSCTTSTARALPVTYEWKLYKGVEFIASAVSVSLDKRYFKLPAYTLDASSVYTVSITASVSPTLSSFVTGILQAGQSGVSTAITGASIRTASTLDTVVLDASSSRDIDYPTASLVYLWSCAVYSPMYGEPCAGFVPSTTSTQSISPSTLTAQIYTISLTSVNTDGKSSTASVHLTMKDTRVPSVSMSSSLYKYNPEDKVILTAAIGTEADSAMAQYSSSSVNISLPGYALTPLIKLIPQGVTNIYQLSIAPNRLTAGLTYTFELTVTYDNNLQNPTTSAISVVINAPPAGGVLTVTPDNGTALITDFTFYTSRWSDDVADLPLKYVLSTYVLYASRLNVVKALDEIPYITTKLGQGLRSLDYVINCVAAAYDIYGGSATALDTVQVKFDNSTTPLLSTTTAALDDALLQSNPTAVQQAVGAALAAVNSVECTVPTVCAVIKRELCSDTANTCGPCLSGFVGPDGDSNVACRAVDSLERLGRKCDTNGVCSIGFRVSSKSCPNNCGGRGVCDYFNYDGKALATCSVADPACYATCTCDAGWFGKNCQLTEFENSQSISIRESLCAGIYQTLSLQDVTADVVKSRALMIGDVMRDINQISDAALYNCTSALVQTVARFPVLSCKDEAFGLVSGALSNILDKGSRLPVDLLAGVTNALTELTAGCQTNLGVGEDPVTLTIGNIKLLTALVDKGSGGSQVFLSPQTSFDAFNRVPAASVQVDGSAVTFSSLLGITVFELINDPKQLRTNSSKVNVKSQQYHDDSPSNLRAETLRQGRRLATPVSEIGVTLVLQNAAPIYYSVVEASNITVRCFEYQTAPYFRNVSCPSGIVLNLTCPALTRGMFAVTCPAERDVPLCTTFNGESFAVDPLCSVMSYTPYNTTCVCQASNSRRYLQSDSEAAVEYSSTFAVVATDIGTTFVHVPSLTDVRRNLVILGTLSGVIALFFVGIFFFLWWDKREEEDAAADSQKTKRKWKVRTITHFYDTIFPDALRADAWHVLFLNQLKSQHSVLRLFTDSKQNHSLRSTHWAIAIGKIVAFIFVSSLMAGLFYPDSGYCEEFTVPEECVTAKTTGGFFDACTWRSENASCEFQPPNIDFLTSTILTLIATMLVVPFDKVIEYNIVLCAQFFHYRSLARRTKPAGHAEEGPTLLRRRFDEFALAQTHRSTLFRAARLEKTRRSSDYVLPEEEASLIMLHAKAEVQRNPGTKLAKLLEQVSSRRMRYTLYAHSVATVRHAVDKARLAASTICKELNAMPTTELQEDFLIRQFIVDTFSAHQRRIVAKYFLTDYNLERTTFVRAQEWMSLIVLPAIVLILIYYVYVFNLSIGSRATNMWLVVTFYCVGQDMILLQPLKIFINTIGVNGSVSSQVRKICEHMSKKSRLYMMRTHGMMRDADALVQHFNPACRAARMFPHLPISRLLMSLNDRDIPQRRLPSTYALPWLYFTTGLLLFTFLPKILQESVLDVASGAIMNFFLVGIYVFGRYSPFATAAIVLCFVSALVAREVYVYRRDQAMQVAQVQHAEQMLQKRESSLEIDSPNGDGNGSQQLSCNKPVQSGQLTPKSITKYKEKKNRALRRLSIVLQSAAKARGKPEEYPTSVHFDVTELDSGKMEDFDSVWSSKRPYSVGRGPSLPYPSPKSSTRRPDFQRSRRMPVISLELSDESTEEEDAGAPGETKSDELTPAMFLPPPPQFMLQPPRSAGSSKFFPERALGEPGTPGTPLLTINSSPRAGHPRFSPLSKHARSLRVRGSNQRSPKDSSSSAISSAYTDQLLRESFLARQAYLRAVRHLNSEPSSPVKNNENNSGNRSELLSASPTSGGSPSRISPKSDGSLRSGFNTPRVSPRAAPAGGGFNNPRVNAAAQEDSGVRESKLSNVSTLPFPPQPFIVAGLQFAGNIAQGDDCDSEDGQRERGTSDESGTVSEVDSTSTLTPLSLGMVYGNSAKETQNFYNIAIDTDANVVVQATSTPEADKNRMRASIPAASTVTGTYDATQPTGADEVATTEVSLRSRRLNRHTPESMPRNEHTSSADRYSPALSVAVAVHSNVNLTAPVPGLEAPAAAHRVANSQPVSRIHPPDMGEQDADSSI